jgi:hypothetical protein
VKDEHPEFGITEVAKELGRRWAVLDPGLKQNYEQRYQVPSRRLNSFIYTATTLALQFAFT